MKYFSLQVLLIFCIFCCENMFGQQNYYKAIYNCRLTSNPNKKAPFGAEEIVKTIESTDVYLLYSQVNSTSYISRVFDTEQMGDFIAKRMLKGDQQYYSNIDGATFYTFITNDGKYLVADSLSIIWTITDSVKYINNIKCRLATGIKPSSSSKFRHSKLFAWYAEDISIPFGPQGINGLPGLIVKTKQVIEYTLSSIEQISPEEAKRILELPNLPIISASEEFKLKNY